MRKTEWTLSVLFSIFCVTLLTSAGGVAVAAEIEEVQFVDSYRMGDSRLRLNNVGLMRYKGLLKAMVAGLYVDDGTPITDVLSDVPKRLEIEYFWPLKAKDIVKASGQLLADNVDGPTLQRLQPQVDSMHAMYADIQPGDRYELTYMPGRGTFLSLNGDFKGVVPGHEFAVAYFSIWLGKQPMDASLKRQLLSRR